MLTRGMLSFLYLTQNTSAVYSASNGMSNVSFDYPPNSFYPTWTNNYDSEREFLQVPTETQADTPLMEKIFPFLFNRDKSSSLKRSEPRPVAVWIQDATITEDLKRHPLSVYYNRGVERILDSLSPYYDIKLYRGVKGVGEMCSILKMTKQKKGNTSLLIITAHGSPSFMEFYNRDHRDASSIPCLARYLPNNVTIVLESCRTADDYVFPVNSLYPEYVIKENIQYELALTIPGSTIWAPKFTMYIASLSFKFEPTFEVWGYSSKEEQILNSVYSILIEIAKYFIDLLYYALFGSAQDFDKHALFGFAANFKNGKFEVISPQSAEFCRQPLQYFKMKKYCDYPTVMTIPSENNLIDCINEKGCMAGLSTLAESHMVPSIKKPEKIELERTESLLSTLWYTLVQPLHSFWSQPEGVESQAPALQAELCLEPLYYFNHQRDCGVNKQRPSSKAMIDCIVKEDCQEDLLKISTSVKTL